MKERYFVEFENYTSVKDIKNCLTSPAHFLSDVTVTELPSILEVKMVETGKIDIPKEWRLVHESGVANVLHGETVTLDLFPELRQLCKPNSIQKTWDFSSIPVGSLVEIVTTHCYYGKFDSEYIVMYIN